MAVQARFTVPPPFHALGLRFRSFYQQQGGGSNKTGVKNRRGAFHGDTATV
jgi:hypothetical protein